MGVMVPSELASGTFLAHGYDMKRKPNKQAKQKTRTMKKTLPIDDLDPKKEVKGGIRTVRGRLI